MEIIRAGGDERRLGKVGSRGLRIILRFTFRDTDKRYRRDTVDNFLLGAEILFPREEEKQTNFIWAWTLLFQVLTEIFIFVR